MTPQHEQTRDDMVKKLAWHIYQVVRATQPSVCCYTERPECIHGEFVGLEDVGLDGNFNFIALADALFGRLS